MTAPVPATSARLSSTNTRVLGGLLLVFGTGWMLKQSGVVDIPWTGVVSLVLIALGLAMVVTARTRARSMPLIALGAVLTIGLTIGSSDIGIKGGIGDPVHRPTALTGDREYRLGIGDMTIDLSGVQLSRPVTTIRGSQSIGHMLVKVPAGTAVRIDARTSLGSTKIFGNDGRGRDRQRFTSDNYAGAANQLHLVLDLFLGEIEVVYA